MILKTLDYRESKQHSGVIEEWNFFDNIVSASNYYDEEIGMTVVRCLFRDESVVTISIPNVAYLMSDNGKTIERIMGAERGTSPDYTGHTETLQDAVSLAVARSI